MAATNNNNYGFDTSKLQPATAPPPVSGTGAGATDVGAGYGGYAESTGLNQGAGSGGKGTYGAGAGNTGTGTYGAGTGNTGTGAYGAGTGNSGTGAYADNGTTGAANPPPQHPAGASTAAGGYNAGTGATTGAGGTTGGGSAKQYGVKAYNRFFKPGARAGAAEKGWDVPLAILAIFVPPLAVFLKVGLISTDFVINVCLTILAWFPGILHAWYVIFIQRGTKKNGGPTDTTTYGANARTKDKTI